MKIRLCSSMLVCVLFSGICLAQGAPTPPREGSLGSPEVSVDFLLPLKDTDLSHYGFGGQLTATHFFSFFSDHVGIQLEGDYFRTHGFDFHDTGVRVGPTVRFSTRHFFQPYAHTLVGYSRVKAGYLKPQNSYHDSGSLLAGGGFEFPLSAGLFARVGADAQYDWSVHTKLVRGLVGLTYQFRY